MIKLIEDTKNDYYKDDINSLLKIVYDFIDNDNNVIMYDDNIEFIRLYSKNSQKIIRDLFDEIVKKWKPKYDENKKLFAKRYTTNLIMIFFRNININISVKNLFHDFNIVKKNQYIMYEILDKLCSPENHNDIFTYCLPKLKEIIGKITPKKFIPKSLKRKYKGDHILIGSDVAKNYYGIKGYESKYIDLINMKDKSYFMSDLYYSVKKYKNIRIYSGKYKCYQYKMFNGKRIANIFVLIKYILIDIIFNNVKFPKFFDALRNINYNKELFNINCFGYNKSKYKQYYAKQFILKKPPWNYIKFIK